MAVKSDDPLVVLALESVLFLQKGQTTLGSVFEVRSSQCCYMYMPSIGSREIVVL